ncbi:GreA/GreB family elongation factor [Solirubrobacter pauli]|nr:GreA/GreB family elongation factor [Solirubrobacter pauli]
MIDQPRSRPSPVAAGAVMLSATDLAEATRELQALRDEQRAEPALLEEAGVTGLRIAHLERLLASATVVETAAGDGAAGLGSHVRVRDAAGREIDYELVGRRASDAPPTKVTLASPVGAALRGARAGDAVHVELPGGRLRPLTVVAVRAAPFTAR